MYRQSLPGTMRLLRVVFTVAMLVASSAFGQPLRATVVAVDTLTNRVKVQTQAGQVIELDTSTKDRQIGEQVTLILPR
jgi:hypothetical protein